jgi:hypothetical protein
MALRQIRYVLVALFALLLLPGCDVLFAPQTDSSGTSPQNNPTATPQNSADADVTHVRAVQTGATDWTFHVTVQHPDTGWDDYADGWDVVLPDGTLANPDTSTPFTRLLLHPHVNEQPFTRSQRGVTIPADVTTVTVRAHDIVDGFGGQTVTVDLTQSSGENYEVERQ